MHDGQRTRGDPSAVGVDDVLTVDLPDDEFIDREYLSQVFADPRKYLAPRGIRASREAERALDRRPESLLARRCKLIGLVTAIAMLVGAVIAAAVVAETPERPYATQDHVQRDFTGVEALGAFSVRHNPSPGSGGERSAPPKTTATPQESPKVTNSPAVNAPPASDNSVRETTSSTDTDKNTNKNTPSPEPTRAARIATPTESASREPTRTTANKFGAVREFYRLVAQAPTRALDMLAPALLDNGPGQLLDAWSGIKDVRIEELSKRADGAVFAVLTMLRPDGQPVRVTQVLHFADSNLIDHVQLLSAQHI